MIGGPFAIWTITILSAGLAYLAGAPLLLAILIGFVTGAHVTARDDILRLSTRIRRLERELLSARTHLDED